MLTFLFLKEHKSILECFPTPVLAGLKYYIDKMEKNHTVSTFNCTPVPLSVPMSFQYYKLLTVSDLDN